MEPNSYQTGNFSYGTNWLVDKHEPVTLKELVLIFIILG